MPTVILMLKAPVEGTVKTRLAAEIGFAAATRIYRRLVEQQIRQIPAGWTVKICYAPSSGLELMKHWLGSDAEYLPQSEGDLGARLSSAMQDHFRNHATPLIIIGGDCPYLDPVRFQEVAALLTNSDAVLVPAVDGGYCLIALSRPNPHAFYSIQWGSDTVLMETRARFHEQNLVWKETSVLEDVDDLASWRRAVLAFPAFEEQTGAA